MINARFRYVAYGAGLLALLVATFANYVLNELGHDEGMYLGASYLAIDHALYSEVGYFQAPNLPLFLSSFYAWSGVANFLLWGRAITFAHHALMLALLAAVAWHHTRSSTASFLFTMWIGLNGFLFGAGYSIDNTTFASTYWLLGYYACLRAHDRGWPSLVMLAAGFFVAVATGFKLNYVSMFPCFVAALALYAPRRALGLFLAGSLVGAVPSIYMLVDRPASFWFDNVVWHRALLAMNVDELGVGTLISGFATDAWHYLSRVTWLATFVIFVPVTVALFVSERKKMWTFERALLGLMLAASLATIACLGAVRFWYLQPVAITIALWVPSVYSQLAARRQSMLQWLLVAAVAVTAFSQTPSIAGARLAMDVRGWVPTRYAAMGEAIATLGPQARAESVATIGNPAIVYGVEGTLPLVRSAATGAFVRVSSPMMDRHSSPIETYERLRGRELEMIVATVDYIAPRAEIHPAAWCDAPVPDDPAGLVAGWCDAGYQLRIFGEGPARVVVFYR